MVYSLNRAQIIGNLTRDPEVRQTPQGQYVASFSVATNFSWKDANGQRQDKVEYHNIVAWRKLAEICKQYLKKGMKIYVEGRIQTREWEGEDGVKRYRTEIIADNLIMLSSKQQDEGAKMNSAYNEERPTQNLNTPKKEEMNKAGAVNDEELTVEDLPF